MNKLLTFSAFFVLVFVSCTTTITTNDQDVNYNYPHDGNNNNAILAVKDYEPLGLIFVKSTEVIDSSGNHTGSKITYGMLMLEAQKLNADDIINIRIDVNQIEESIKVLKNSNQLYWSNYNDEIFQTTYNYTAVALAIKYTSAIPVENTEDIQRRR